MIKTTITFALQNSRTAQPDDIKRYMERAMDYMFYMDGNNHAQKVGGATWTEHERAYTMNDGELVLEPSYSIEVLSEQPLSEVGVNIFAEVIKVIEEQESVLIETTQVGARFK